MDKKEKKTACSGCDKARSGQKVISSEDGAVILYIRDEKKLTYKAKNNKNYDV